MNPALSTEIEGYLLDARRWVPAAELSARFGCRERAFRALGDQPGLCSRYAISGDKGFKHIVHATDQEFDRFYRRLRSHGLGELVHIRRLKRRRAELQAKGGRPPAVVEKTTGQVLLFTDHPLPA